LSRDGPTTTPPHPPSEERRSASRCVRPFAVVVKPPTPDVTHVLCHRRPLLFMTRHNAVCPPHRSRGTTTSRTTTSCTRAT
jgi:hypothetical protein